MYCQFLSSFTHSQNGGLFIKTFFNSFFSPVYRLDIYYHQEENGSKCNKIKGSIINDLGGLEENSKRKFFPPQLPLYYFFH